MNTFEVLIVIDPVAQQPPHKLHFPLNILESEAQQNSLLQFETKGQIGTCCK